jgi:hypothetical protein
MENFRASGPTTTNRSGRRGTSSCSSLIERATEKAAEEGVERAIEADSGEDVELDFNADEGSFSIETEDGSFISGSGAEAWELSSLWHGLLRPEAAISDTARLRRSTLL